MLSVQYAEGAARVRRPYQTSMLTRLLCVIDTMSVCLQIGVEAAGSLLRTPLQNEERCTWWPCAKVMSLAQKKSVERPALSGFLPLGGFPHYLTCQPAVMCSYCN
ncbi:uncharacterized protein LOC144014227 isoform X2 [Festucalex cinctus]